MLGHKASIAKNPVVLSQKQSTIAKQPNDFPPNNQRPILRSWSEGNRVYNSGFSFRQFYPNPELNFDKNTAKKLAF